MNYSKIYEELINKAKEKKAERLGLHYLGELYVERHHIIPRSHGGSDDESNLVPLTPREHYMAHRLLAKMYPTCGAMAKAVWFMSEGKLRKTRPIPSRTYDRLKSLAAASHLGKGNSQYKPARIRCKKTGRFIASNVCLTEWGRMNGVSPTGLRKTATGQQKTTQQGFIAEFIL